MVRALPPILLAGLLLAATTAFAQAPSPEIDRALVGAEDLIAADRIEDARQTLLRILLVVPRDVRVPFLLAQCELNDAIRSGEEKEFEKARAWLRKADQIEPRYGPTAYLWGMIGLKTKDYRNAVNGFQEALRRGYRPLVTRGNIAHALFLLGEELAGPAEREPEPAIEVLEQARKRLEALKDDTRQSRQVRDVFRALWIRAQVNIAALHQTAGNYPEAQKFLEELIRIEPGNAQHHYNLGLLHGEGQRWELALAKYREALRIANDPQFAEPHLKIGYIYSQRGQPEEAEAEFKLFFDVFPDDWFGHFYLGQHYQRNERYEEALRSLIRCVELDQDSYASIAAVAKCLLRLGRTAEAKVWQEFFKLVKARARDKKTPKEGERTQPPK